MEDTDLGTVHDSIREWHVFAVRICFFLKLPIFDITTKQMVYGIGQDRRNYIRSINYRKCELRHSFIGYRAAFVNL